MPKRFFTVVFIVGIILVASSLHAASAKMLFWYPGEAGSTAEAQPVLDEFFAYIKGKDDGIALTGAETPTVRVSVTEKEAPSLSRATTSRVKAVGRTRTRR